MSNVVPRYSNKVVKDVSSIIPKGPASSYKRLQPRTALTLEKQENHLLFRNFDLRE